MSDLIARGMIGSLYQTMQPAANESSIRQAANALSQNGGGVVLLPNAMITLTSSLPLLQGVKYVGVEPVLIPQNSGSGYMPDAEWNYGSGTVLKGDGTFPAFSANVTDQASPSPNLGTTQISGTGIINVGLDTFSYGIKCGAVNIMGAVYSEFRRIYAKNCGQWGFYFANFQHCEFERLFTCLCQNGQYYGSLLAASVLMPGNAVLDDIFNLKPRDGRNNLLCRGIVFEASSSGSTAKLNEINAKRIQSNCFNVTELNDTVVTLTNGSTSIGVTNGANYAVGMPLVFASTIGGFTAGQIYVVLSVNANTITLGNARQSAAISATASGTATINSYGFANLELMTQYSSSGISNSRFENVDVEGVCTAAIYSEGTTCVDVSISEFPGTQLVGICARYTSQSRFKAMNAAVTDFDSNSTNSYVFGQVKQIYNRAPQGQYINQQQGNIYEWKLTNANSGAGNNGGDLQAAASGLMIYPNLAFGEHVYTRTTAIALSAIQAGTILFDGSTAVTFTLPTIVDPAGTSQSMFTGNLGMWFEFVNVGSATLTIASGNGELFNEKAATTSISLLTGNTLRIRAVKASSGSLIWLGRVVTTGI